MKGLLEKAPPWLGYVLPMGLFVVLTFAESNLPGRLYPLVYTVKAALVGLALLFCAPAWRAEIRPDARAGALGLATGLVGFGLWIGLDPWTPHLSFLGARSAYDPFQQIPDAALRTFFLAVRFIGLVLLVPVMEEVFWRSFLLRFVTDQDRWRDLPQGTFSLLSAGIGALMFGAAHPEWLVAVLFALLMAGLLRATRSLFACLVAHAGANLALGIYVLLTGAWKYW